MKSHFSCLLMLTAITCLTDSSFAQKTSYPLRPIRLVVPFPAGGGADILARTIGQKMTESLGQSIVVDNRAGAAGIIGTDIVAKAVPDGYTLLMLASNLAILEAAGGRRPYDLVHDLHPISLIAAAPNILIVNPAVPATSVPQLISRAKSDPGKLHFASNGVGSSSHLSAELFKVMAGVDMVHVPYKGGPPGVAATLAGETQVMFSAILHVLPHAKAGKLRALAVTGKTRSQVVPEVPTIAESGLTGYESIQWWMMMAPAKVSSAVASTLHQSLIATLSAAELKARITQQGADPLSSTSQQARSFLNSEIIKWRKIINSAGIKLD
jgi:tripartite-type tricarboxylate transporter receptor subunit TctC